MLDSNVIAHTKGGSWKALWNSSKVISVWLLTQLKGCHGYKAARMWGYGCTPVVLQSSLHLSVLSLPTAGAGTMT